MVPRIFSLRPGLLRLDRVDELCACGIDATQYIASRWSAFARKGEGGRWVVPLLFPVKALREQGDPTDEPQAQLAQSPLSLASWEDP